MEADVKKIVLEAITNTGMRYINWNGEVCEDSESVCINEFFDNLKNHGYVITEMDVQ